MVHELPKSHKIELKMARELVFQLRQLKEQPGWRHLCTHIADKNKERRASVEAPAYSMELMQKQNFDKGVIIGSEMFAAGVDFEINRLTNEIAALESKIGADDDEHDTE